MTFYISLNLSEEFAEYVAEICLKIQKIIKNETGYEFNPMRKTGVHMTICFLGKIKKYGDLNMKFIEEKKEEFSNKFDGITLEFDDYKIFSRGNLIVAAFKCKNISNNKFVNDIIEYKNSFVNNGANEENYFTPHLTLGKIQNVPKKGPNFNFSDLLKSAPVIQQSITIDGCHLCT
jgi:2'-5' RNA ligase